MASVAQAAVIAREDVPGNRRLVAYVMAAADASVDPAALRAHLGASLPDYMMPSAFVTLDKLPLTPNGKLDRKALPAPDLTPANVWRGPRTPQEEMLCALFAEVLGLERVGIDDNFFALGGDSIMSIQLVSRARKAGLVITPRAVFQHQTVEGLAGIAGLVQETAAALPDLATGALPATPIMRRLAEQGGPIERFNQAMLLQVPAGLQEKHLIAALQAMLDHHDALRLRHTPSSQSTDLSLEIAPAGTVDAKACIRRIDVCGLDDAELRGCISEAAQAAERRLAPAAGMMVQAVWFDAGADVAGRLLLTIHHLAVDGVSWRILLPDLAAAWEAIANGREPALPARSTSFRRWAQRLTVEAQDAERVGELSFWTGMLSEPSLSLVEGALDPDRDTGGTARHLTLTLPAALTGALLTRVPAAFHGGINDVLLTGLVVASADWCRHRGRGGASQSSDHALLLDLEGHGREEIFGRRRSLAHGGLVHQPVPVAARPRRARPRRGHGRRRRARPRGEDHQGAVARAARQRARLWPAALSESADGSAARRPCGAAARLQLSRTLRGCGGGLGRGARGGAARRRRSAARSRARGQCVHAR